MNPRRAVTTPQQAPPTGAFADVHTVSADFEVSTSRRDSGQRVVLTVAGDVDHDTASILRACLAPHLRPAGPAVLALDMTGVTFLGAGGLAVLAGAHREAAENGQRLTVSCTRHGGVTRLLALTGLMERLDVDLAVGP